MLRSRGQTVELAVPRTLVASLYGRSGAAQWAVTLDEFTQTLQRVVTHHAVPEADVGTFLERLHLQDLVLALACARGHERAWEHFLVEYRPVLARAADAVDPTGGARELADALFGDLFGADVREGVRQSLLLHYHGRSSLATWLRAVLARRHVDRLRATRRLHPLPEGEWSAPTEPTVSAAPDQGRFRVAFTRALTGAVGKLDARDRLRLACYYAQRLTLAQIGRLLGEHEATVSRQLTRVRGSLRRDVEQALQGTDGFDASTLQEGFAALSEDAGDLDLTELLSPPRKAGRLVRSKSGAMREERG